MDNISTELKDKVDLLCKDFFNYCPEDQKRSKIFLKWIIKKVHFFHSETKPLKVPEIVFPKKLNSFEYNYCKSDVREIIKLYYFYRGGDFHYLNKRVSMSDEHKYILLHRLILIRGNIVWIDFGFNVGREFGGIHPAIILKNTGETLIVAPLSTLKEGKKMLPSDVPIEQCEVFGLDSIRRRFVNVNRVQPVSIYRLCFGSRTGRVKGTVVNKICKRLAREWRLFTSL